MRNHYVAAQVAPEFDNTTSVETLLPVACCTHPLVDYVKELREVAVAAAENFRQRHPGGTLPTVVIAVPGNTLFTLDTRECAGIDSEAPRLIVLWWQGARPCCESDNFASAWCGW